MQLKKYIVIVAMFVGIVSAGEGKAQDTLSGSLGVIKGVTVNGRTQKPIEGALIKYDYGMMPDITKVLYAKVSDKKGCFQTEPLLAGRIVSLYITAEGYQSQKKEVVINDADGLDVNVKLFPVNYRSEEFEKRKAEAIAHIQAENARKITKDIQILYGDFREIYNTLDSDKQGCIIKGFSEKLQTITVYGLPESIEKLEKIKARYDVPPKQIWLEVLLIKASGNGGGKPDYPPEIDSIVSKLRSLFKFGKYTIIGRGNAMGLEGSNVSFSGRIENDQEALVQHPFRVQTRLGAAGDIIKLQGLKVTVTLPQNEIATSINVKNGETVILGASRGKSSEEALITVVTAKIME